MTLAQLTLPVRFFDLGAGVFQCNAGSLQVTVTHDPELWPGVDGSQLAKGATGIFVTQSALNARQLKNAACLCNQYIAGMGVNKFQAAVSLGRVIVGHEGLER